MKQRFSKRTRLVSALLTLAMVFTFLPFSAFAATVQEIEELNFTTHGCDALQITEGGSVGEWIKAFRKKWRKREKTGENGRRPELIKKTCKKRLTSIAAGCTICRHV